MGGLNALRLISEVLKHYCWCINKISQGEEVDLDPAWEARYTEAYETLGGMGERVLGFAFKNMKDFNLDYPFTNKPEPNFPIDDLTFCGLFSLIDPPKEGVPEAVAKCKRARIKVFMVTGTMGDCCSFVCLLQALLQCFNRYLPVTYLLCIHNSIGCEVIVIFRGC